MSVMNSEVSRWIRENAHALKGVAAGSGFEDLDPLRKWFADARVVGMGEATHGTREFFQLKHRIFEFLVSELGFTLFIIESPFAEPLALNQYVLSGEGDLGRLMASTPHFFWNCDEVSELIEWIRQWNAKHDRKVFFYGCDLDSSAPAAMFLLDYLRRRNATAYSRLREALRPLATNAHMLARPPRTEEDRARTLAIIGDVAATLDRMQEEDGRGRYELGLAKIQASVLRQNEEWWNPGLSGSSRMGVRDRCMAENIAALLKLHGPDAKAMVWAHNGHIQLCSSGFFGNVAPPLGEHLRRLFGDRYVAVALAFDHGTFSAVDESLQLCACVAPSVPETFDSSLAAAGPPQFGIDLREVSKPVAEWFAEGWPTRYLASQYSAAWDDKLWTRFDMRRLFDAVMFVRETSASKVRQNALYRDECYREHAPSPQGLTNLDFSDGVTHWRRFPEPPLGGYEISVADEGGESSVEISRAASSCPWDVCALSQTTSAVPWRGKQITVRCSARIDATHDGGSAQLAIRVLDEMPGGRSTLSAAERQKRPQWSRAATSNQHTEELILTAHVGIAAETLEIAILMTGDGRACFGPIGVAVGQ